MHSLTYSSAPQVSFKNQRILDEIDEKCLQILENGSDFRRSVAGVELLHQRIIRVEVEHVGATRSLFPRQLDNAFESRQETGPVAPRPGLAPELPENEPSGVQKLLLKVRHGSDPCGPLGAGTNALPRLATVVVADQKARQFAIEDTAAGEHAGGLSGADLLRRLRLELLARASCRLADEIAARIYGDQESGRLAPILADE